ncbi:hypothetical protein ACSBR2_024080 [Camellia fascicularis]
MEKEEEQQSSTQTTPLLGLPRWRHRLTILPYATNLCLIPVVLALTLVCHLDLSTTLIFTSLYNISTGLLFGTPMPV